MKFNTCVVVNLQCKMKPFYYITTNHFISVIFRYVCRLQHSDGSSQRFLKAYKNVKHVIFGKSVLEMQSCFVFDMKFCVGEKTVKHHFANARRSKQQMINKEIFFKAWER